MALKAFGQVFTFVQRKIYGCCRCAPTQTQSLTRGKKLFFLQIKKANCPKSHVEFSLVMNEMSFKEGMTAQTNTWEVAVIKCTNEYRLPVSWKPALSRSYCKDARWGKKQLIQQTCFSLSWEQKKKKKKSKCGWKWIMVWGQPEISKMTF